MRRLRPENFLGASSGKDPVWMPNSLTDKIALGTNDVIAHKVRGMQIHSDFLTKATEDYEFKDWFNTDWTWVCSAGGIISRRHAALRRHHKWEQVVEFPARRMGL